MIDLNPYLLSLFISIGFNLIIFVIAFKFQTDKLTDITYVELKPEGTELDSGDIIGEVESVKTTSDVYSALAGEIIETNDAVIDNPALLNDDPYNAAWLVKVQVSDPSPFETLADATRYDAEFAQ